MNEIISTKIIVLKKTAYQESSLIVSAISAEFGKISFLIRSAKKISSRKQPIVDIFRELTVEFKEGKSELNNVQSVDLLNDHDRIAQCPEIFIEVSYLAMFLLRNTYPNVPCGKTYSAFKNLLEKSSKGKAKPFDFTLFKLVFLSENGLLPIHYGATPNSKSDCAVEEEKQRKFLSTLMSYAEGNASTIPPLPIEYQSKLKDWVANQCRCNGLE